MNESIDSLAVDVPDDALYDVIGTAFEALPDDFERDLEKIPAAEREYWLRLGPRMLLRNVFPNVPEERIDRTVDQYCLLCAAPEGGLPTCNEEVPDAFIDAWLIMQMNELVRLLGGFSFDEVEDLVGDSFLGEVGVPRERLQRRLARHAGLVAPVTDARIPDRLIDERIAVAIRQLTNETGSTPTPEAIVARVSAVLPPVSQARIAGRLQHTHQA